jgi:hypothetical protein
MVHSRHQRWQENGAGLGASLLLHGLVLALWLFWSLGHPVLPAPPLKAMLVDLVRLPVVAPGIAGGAPQVARPREARAPKAAGETPKAVTPPPDMLEARIASLASLNAPASLLPAPDNDGTSGGNGAGGGYALADFVRAQILRRWWPNLDSDAARATPVTIRLKMTRAGVIFDIVIVDQQRFDHDKLFHGLALSARNAAILASPIPLPPGKYDAVMDISITLDPKAVLH